MPRPAQEKPAPNTSTATIGFEADFGPEHADTFRRDLRADTATRVSANPQPRSHLVGLLRSERQLIANPPFNDSHWHRKDDDVRGQPSGARTTAKGSPSRRRRGIVEGGKWAREGERGGVHQFGVPPKGNANFAWVQHFIHHLALDGNINGRQTLN